MPYTFTSGEVATAAKLNQTIPGLATQAGAVVVTPVANVLTSVQITFAAPFVNTPRVLASPVTILPGSHVKGVAVAGISKTGFTIWILRTTSTNTTIMWQAYAVQPATFTDGQPVSANALSAGSATPLTPVGGIVNINAGGSTPVSASVTFPAAFQATPIVVVSPATTLPGTVRQCSLANLTASGFTAYMYRTGGTVSTPLHWLAMGRL